MQFPEHGRYLAVIVDGTLRVYGRLK